MSSCNNIVNPLVERLPPVDDAKATGLCLGFAPPKPSDDFFAAPWYVRLDALANRNEIHMPLQHEVDAYRQILSNTRRCLFWRNPANPRVKEHLYKVSQLGEADWKSGRATLLLNHLITPMLNRQIPSGGGALGFTIDGPTGIGKSSFSDRLYHAFKGDEPEIHTSINGEKCKLTQMKILRTSCTGEGLKDVCYDLLQRGDAILGTDYSRVGRKSTALWEYVSQVHRMTTAHYLGLLLIDDMHRLADFDAQTEKTLRLFANFMQATGIPIVILGTYRVRKVLGSAEHLQEGSKLMALGYKTFGPLSCKTEWHRLNEAFWAYRVSHPELNMPEWLPVETHWVAQGIPRYLRFVMDEFFRRMVMKPRVKVTLELLRESAETALAPYQKPLNVLRELAIGVKLSAEKAAIYEHLLATAPVPTIKKPADYPETAKKSTGDAISPNPEDPDLADTNTPSAPAISSPASQKSNTKRNRRVSNARGISKLPDESEHEIDKVTKTSDPHQAARDRGWCDEFKL